MLTNSFAFNAIPSLAATSLAFSNPSITSSIQTLQELTRSYLELQDRLHDIQSDTMHARMGLVAEQLQERTLLFRCDAERAIAEFMGIQRGSSSDYYELPYDFRDEYARSIVNATPAQLYMWRSEMSAVPAETRAMLNDALDNAYISLGLYIAEEISADRAQSTSSNLEVNGNGFDSVDDAIGWMIETQDQMQLREPRARTVSATTGEVEEALAWMQNTQGDITLRAAAPSRTEDALAVPQPTEFDILVGQPGMEQNTAAVIHALSAEMLGM